MQEILSLLLLFIIILFSSFNVQNLVWVPFVSQFSILNYPAQMIISDVYQYKHYSLFCLFVPNIIILKTVMNLLVHSFFNVFFNIILLFYFCWKVLVFVSELKIKQLDCMNKLIIVTFGSFRCQNAASPWPTFGFHSEFNWSRN